MTSRHGNNIPCNENECSNNERKSGSADLMRSKFHFTKINYTRTTQKNEEKVEDVREGHEKEKEAGD
jgi:hypothetical protein